MVDWTQPVRLNFAQPVPLVERLVSFFGHNDTRVYVTDQAWVDVGAGSMVAMAAIQSHAYLSGCVGHIGRHSAFGRMSALMIGMEHANEQPVNTAFAPCHALLIEEPRFGLAEPKSLDIGNAVVLSASTIVLDGVRIGDGVVLGAGAVLTRPAEPFGIYAGNPARHLRQRFGPETMEAVRAVRWWDFHPAYIVENKARLQELAVTEGDHPRLGERPRLVFNREGGLLGWAEDERARPLAEAPRAVQEYVAHVYGDGPYTWVADIWSYR